MTVSDGNSEGGVACLNARPRKKASFLHLVDWFEFRFAKVKKTKSGMARTIPGISPTVHALGCSFSSPLKIMKKGFLSHGASHRNYCPSYSATVNILGFFLHQIVDIKSAGNNILIFDDVIWK